MRLPTDAGAARLLEVRGGEVRTFDPTEAGRIKPSSYYDRVVDVVEELFKFTLHTPPSCRDESISRPSEKDGRRR